MQRAVEFSVAASVEPVADGLAGGGGDRGCAGESCEGGFRFDPAAVGPRQDELSCGVRTDAWLLEQLRRELAGERFDLVGELAFLGGQLQHASGDRAQREQAAAQLGVVSAMRSGCCEALQKPCTCQRPQLAPQRLRGCDQQVAQLAEPGPFRVHGSFACGHKCLQRLAFTTRSRCCGPLACEDTPAGTERVERVGLAAPAALPAQAAHLEDPLALGGEQARQAGTERAGALDRERSPTRGVFVGELQSLRVEAVTEAQTIYVELLDEGVTVYRPVESTPDRDGAFRLPATAPAGEHWRFEPGSRVVCEQQSIGGEELELVAVRPAS